MSPAMLLRLLAVAAGVSLSLAQYPNAFTKLSDNALSFYDDITQNFGPEDKMLECNDNMVFIDLDQAWEQVCANCVGGNAIGECTVLAGAGSLQPATIQECKANCTANPNCTEINWNANPPGSGQFAADCVLRSCTINPPSTVPDDTKYQVWTYNRGTALTYNASNNSWIGYTISAAPCPDPDQPPAPLVPRDSGYTVGIVFDRGVGGGDRLLVIGGDQNENNVYFSDDCGRSWQCYDGENIFDPRGFPAFIHPPKGMFPGDPLHMLGGDIQDALPSIGHFVNLGDGTSNWARPTCTDPGNCNNACDNPDTYCVPDSPVFPGQVVNDWTTMWLWLDRTTGPFDNTVWWLNLTNYASGWTQLQGANSANVMGRRAYVRGPVPGSGCFFSTDYTAGRLWENDGFDVPDASSTNTFYTSRTPAGPWIVGTAPWVPRASAVVVAGEEQDRIWVGGGFTFSNGQAQLPAFGDVWTVNASVCLLGANGTECSGRGTVDMQNFVCTCPPAYQGDDRCGSCTFGTYGSNCGNACPSGVAGFCDAGTGWGTCNAAAPDGDPDKGCVCSGNHAIGTGPCDACTPTSAGSDCAPCAPCDAVGGSCSGAGTTSGSGACVCNAGYYGEQCKLQCPSGAFGTCDTDNGWGACDPVLGCVCLGDHAIGTGPCDACKAGFWGTGCSECAPCDPAGGTCSGSGTTGGDGTCQCKDGYFGADCSQNTYSATATRSRAPGSPTKSPYPTATPTFVPPAPAAGLSAGGAAAVSLAVLSLGAAGGLFVFAKFFGGGPALAAAAGKVTGIFSSSAGGGGGSGAASSYSSRSVERTSLLGGAKATPLSPAQVANRFGSPR